MRLSKEFQYYIDNQEELALKHKNKFIVIVGDKVVGVYDNISEAYSKPQEKYELGTFFIQQTGLGTENYTQIINRCML